jgi:hypothetical protein
MGEVELKVQDVHRMLDDAVQPFVKNIRYGEADEQKDDGADESLAELVEVLHQAHAWEFCSVGDSGAGPVD